MIDMIASLEARRKELLLHEQILNEAYWIAPYGPAAKGIDDLLEDVCDEIDFVSNQLERMIDEDRSRDA